MGLTFLGPMDTEPSGPSGPVFAFILFSCPFHPIWSVAIYEKGPIGVMVKWKHADGSMLIARRSRYRHEWWQVYLRWQLKMLSGRWYNQRGDGWNLQRMVTRIIGWQLKKNEVVRCIEFWQAVQRYLRRTTRVVCRLACISDRSVASSSVHPFYKN